MSGKLLAVTLVALSVLLIVSIGAGLWLGQNLKPATQTQTPVDPNKPWEIPLKFLRSFDYQASLQFVTYDKAGGLPVYGSRIRDEFVVGYLPKGSWVEVMSIEEDMAMITFFRPNPPDELYGGELGWVSVSGLDIKQKRTDN